MNGTRLVAFALAAALVCGVGGCRKLNFKQSLTLGPGDIRSFKIDPPRGEQRVAITVQSSNVPVTVAVVPGEQLDAAMGGKPVSGALAKKEKVKDETFEVTIPAKKEVAVVVSDATKDTEVTVTIVGK